MNPEIVEKFLDQTYCHQCGSLLSDSEVTIVFESAGTSFLHVRCHECQGETMATVNRQGYSLTDVRTSLTPEEMQRFLKLPPISVDDLLDLHELAQKDQLCQLLKQKRGTSSGKKSNNCVRKVCSPELSPKKVKFQSP